MFDIKKFRDSDCFTQEYDDDIISEDDNKFLMGISYTDLKKMTEDDLRKLYSGSMVDEMVLILKESRVDLKKKSSILEQRAAEAVKDL